MVNPRRRRIRKQLISEKLKDARALGIQHIDLKGLLNLPSRHTAEKVEVEDKKEIETLKESQESQNEKVEQKEEPQKKKAGRPPKNVS